MQGYATCLFTEQRWMANSGCLEISSETEMSWIFTHDCHMLQDRSHPEQLITENIIPPHKEAVICHG